VKTALNARKRRVKITLIVDTDIPLWVLKSKGEWASALSSLSMFRGKTEIKKVPMAENLDRRKGTKPRG